MVINPGTSTKIKMNPYYWWMSLPISDGRNHVPSKTVNQQLANNNQDIIKQALQAAYKLMIHHQCDDWCLERCGEMDFWTSQLDSLKGDSCGPMNQPTNQAGNDSLVPMAWPILAAARPIRLHALTQHQSEAGAGYTWVTIA